MRGLTSTSLLAAAGLVQALPELSISKRDAKMQDSHVARGLVKRAGTVGTNVYDVLAWSEGGAYYANVTVGTPPQSQVVILDTGSSDLYFDASNSSTCESTGPNSCRGGTFDSGSSSTFSIAAASPAFNTSFGDGSTAVGPFGEDVVGIGNVVVSGVQFGVAEQVDATTGYAIGLMGLGYSENEATSHQYPNMPEVLRDAGVINSRLYSIFLNSVSALSGTILFGGIDTSKYTGELVTIDLLPDEQTGEIDQFVTTVTSLVADVNGTATTLFSGGTDGIAAYGNNDNALAVLLDTGSAAWSVPQSYYEKLIAPSFPFVDQNFLCSCAHRTDDASVVVEFAGKINVTIPVSEFIVPVYNSTTNEPVPYDSTADTCAFMIVPGSDLGDGFLTLGDAILHSMYVVFDLDNGQVAIAQAAVNSTASPNIVTVSSGTSGIASAISTSFTGAPAPTWSIAAEVSNTYSFTVSTAQSTVGVATGTAAVPADAQPSAASSGKGSSSSSGSSTSSSAAATSLVVPAFEWTQMWVAALAATGVAVGLGIMV